MHARSMKALKKKGWIQQDNIPLKIVFSLYNAGKPLSLSEIARMCKSQRQKVDYHIRSLVTKGVIYSNQNNMYTIQPGLMNSTLVELLEPLIAAVLKDANLSQADMPLEETASNIIEYFLQLHVLE